MYFVQDCSNVEHACLLNEHRWLEILTSSDQSYISIQDVQIDGEFYKVPFKNDGSVYSGLIIDYKSNNLFVVDKDGEVLRPSLLPRFVLNLFKELEIPIVNSPKISELLNNYSIEDFNSYLEGTLQHIGAEAVYAYQLFIYQRLNLQIEPEIIANWAESIDPKDIRSSILTQFLVYGFKTKNFELVERLISEEFKYNALIFPENIGDSIIRSNPTFYEYEEILKYILSSKNHKLYSDSVVKIFAQNTRTKAYVFDKDLPLFNNIGKKTISALVYNHINDQNRSGMTEAEILEIGKIIENNRLENQFSYFFNEYYIPLLTNQSNLNVFVSEN